MTNRIDWRLFNGDHLNHSGLNDPELDALHKLFGEAFINSSGISYSRFLQYAADNTVLVGSLGEDIAAISTYSYQPYTSESYMLVNTIAVDERYRRQGIGSEIINRVIGDATYLDCDNVRLLARKSVLPFYEQHGFVRNNNLETDLGYVPMHRKISQVALSAETTLRTLAKTV